MTWKNVGFQRQMPFDIDFYDLTNEDIGFVANLVTGTNDVYQFPLPYPSSINLNFQTIVLWAIDFELTGENSVRDDNQGWLGVYMSMLERNFLASFQGSVGDTEDENAKAQLQGPYSFGIKLQHPTDGTLASPFQWNNDVMVKIRIYPVVPLRLLTPVYFTMFNQTVTIDPATGDDTAANFTLFENMRCKPWFTISNLTQRELDLRSSPTVRFQRLDS